VKAIVLVRHGEPNQAFELRNLPDPPTGAGQVAVEVEASGLNFADVLARNGLYREAPRPPCILGYDVVGKVSEVGRPPASGPSHAPPLGTRVVAFTRFGGYASRVVTSAAAVVALPDTLDAVEATALATQYCTAWYAAEECVRLHPGDHVVVQAAAGGVGTALVQLAKRRGATVYGTAGSQAKLEHLRRLGVDHAIDYRAEDFAAAVLGRSGGRRPDVVFDSLGGRTWRRALGLLAGGGRLVGFGLAEIIGPGPRLLRTLRAIAGFGLVFPPLLFLRSQGILGINLLQIADQRPEVLRGCLVSVVELAAKGELAPVAGGAYPPERVAEAHAALEDRRTMGKLAIVWR
jgi:NADPH:quinone reductase-like Zn-dependent oxidoreductase